MAAICNVPVALRATAKRTVAKRGMSVKAAAGPQHWLPGTEPPAYLDGTMAGDYGFDPLRLGQNPETLPYLQEAELMNGRWAMHATAGILFTDAVGLPKFWEAGEAALGDWDIKTLVAIQVVVMGFLEAARIRGFMATGESGVVGNFPARRRSQDLLRALHRDHALRLGGHARAFHENRKPSRRVERDFGPPLPSPPDALGTAKRALSLIHI